MRVSKYVNLDANILMEYIYDDSNLISEPYEILNNTKDKTTSFLSTTSGSLNTLTNNLFEINSISRNYGITNPTNYTFLQVNNYSSGFPLRYDTIVIHLPISYTFGNNIGFYLRVYGFDINNLNKYDLCNFFFDITNVSTKSYIDYTAQPFIYNETLWGKQIVLSIPSLYAISNQRTSNITTANSLNFNLTNGVGLNQQTPIFFEFSFINTSQTINGVKTYKLSSILQTSVPQIPEFQQIGVVIEPASDGDYFQIFGIYNGDITEFKNWIEDSVFLGNRYYVNYRITMYEQNIRGNSLNITVTDNFNTPIEFRPIIKYSSTTAIIQVEMDVIDAVSNSSIIRKASYGMLPDEVSKFSRYLTKINLGNAMKPKIYNTRSSNSSSNYQVSPVMNIQTVSLPFSVLVDSANVVAQSDNVIAGSKLYYGDGKLILLIKPFDTYVKLNLYTTGNTKTQNPGITASTVGTASNTTTITPFDLTSYGTLKLTFKNSQYQYDFPLYTTNADVDVSKGIVTFLVPSSSVSNLRNMVINGPGNFYIVGTVQNSTSVIYSGLFDLYDSNSNLNNLIQAATQQISAAAASSLQIQTEGSSTNSANNTVKSNFKNQFINNQDYVSASPVLASDVTRSNVASISNVVTRNVRSISSNLNTNLSANINRINL
jgi:hypothetical protein